LDLVVKKTSDADLKELDLSRIDALLIGAEPIRPNALIAFEKKFAVCGFKENVKPSK
jgi:hypothetical protein